MEPEAHYPQWRRIHQPIERCSVLHESLIKLIEGLEPKYVLPGFEMLIILNNLLNIYIFVHFSLF